MYIGTRTQHTHSASHLSYFNSLDHLLFWKCANAVEFIATAAVVGDIKLVDWAAAIYYTT